MQRKINLIALVAGISTLLLIAVSVFVPWWQFTVGKPAFAQVNFSPVNLNFSILGNPLTIPLIWAMNLACILTLASGGIIMLIYSMVPTKPYAKRLLGFGWKKPLYAVILFVIELIALSTLVKTFSGFDFPLMGSAILTLPSTLTSGSVNISFSVLAEFGWPFYFAFVVAGLCVAARLYHRKIPLPLQPAPPSPPINSPSTLKSKIQFFYGNLFVLFVFFSLGC